MILNVPRPPFPVVVTVHRPEEEGIPIIACGRSCRHDIPGAQREGIARVEPDAATDGGTQKTCVREAGRNPVDVAAGEAGRETAATVGSATDQGVVGKCATIVKSVIGRQAGARRTDRQSKTDERTKG